MAKLKTTAKEYVMARIEIQPTGCWLWTGTTGGGYGIARRGPDFRSQQAHRFAWEAWHGPIPPGHHIGHKTGCSSTYCVNPSHVEPQTPSENSREMHARYVKRVWAPGERELIKADLLYGPGDQYVKGVRHGLSRRLVQLIKQGARWADVELHVAVTV